MVHPRTLFLVAAASLPLAACAPPADTGTNLTPPPPTQQFAAADAKPKDSKAFDMNEDGKVSAGEAVGGAVLVGGFLALCPLCVLGM